jgi:hypothetical protein
MTVHVNDKYLIPAGESHRVREDDDGSLLVVLRDGAELQVPPQAWSKDVMGWKIPYQLVDEYRSRQT